MPLSSPSLFCPMRSSCCIAGRSVAVFSAVAVVQLGGGGLVGRAAFKHLSSAMHRIACLLRVMICKCALSLAFPYHVPVVVGASSWARHRVAGILQSPVGTRRVLCRSSTWSVVSSAQRGSSCGSDTSLMIWQSGGVVVWWSVVVQVRARLITKSTSRPTPCQTTRS